MMVPLCFDIAEDNTMTDLQQMHLLWLLDEMH